MYEAAEPPTAVVTMDDLEWGKAVDMHLRENGWNGRIDLNPKVPPKMDPVEAYRAGRERASLSPNKAEAEAYKRPTKGDIRMAYYTTLEQSDAAPGFASVAAAFEFVHHVGTDPALELQALKAILIREGFVGQLQSASEDLLRCVRCRVLRALPPPPPPPLPPPLPLL